MTKIIMAKVIDEKESGAIDTIIQCVKDYAEDCNRLSESYRREGCIASAKVEAIRASSAELVLEIIDAAMNKI